MENSGPERARSDAMITAVNRAITATVPVLCTAGWIIHPANKPFDGHRDVAERVIETGCVQTVLQSVGGLLQIAERPVQGPTPSFQKPHLVLAFITIGDRGTVGRQALAVQSGMTEAPVRTIIKKLREGGYAETNASGCYLTGAGQGVYESLRSRLTQFLPIEGSQLTMGEFQLGLVVKGGGKAVRSGLEQRDSAIALRAAGATTFVLKEGKFTVPGGSDDCERDFPSGAWATLRKKLKPRNGDAVIVCGAKDETTAKLGALSAALTLL